MDYRQYIPSSIRLYGKQFFNPTDITEKDFTDKELNAERNTFLNANSREEARNKELVEAVRRGDTYIDDAGWSIPAREIQEAYMRQRGTIGYGDYNGRENPADSWEQGIGKSLQRVFVDPDFNMKNTLGRSRFHIDNGDVIVTDTYDFDNIDEGTLPFRAAHSVARMFGTPMDVRINLGNPKDWR